MKVVINNCFGGFGLSPIALKRICELKGRECYFFTENKGKYIPIPVEKITKKEPLLWYALDIPNPTDGDYHAHSCQEDFERNDPLLIQVVEELGLKDNGMCANLKIVEIPDDVEWEIEEYDGNEHIAESHRTWS